ncbi:abl interactor 2 isoform X2 [Aricia agestis]|nr:abl interactor 2 isoform X2 [Aricia agestis]
MKGPARPAPAVPGMQVNRYFPVTNWNDDPFGDVFEPTPNFAQKKKPPPRPPPPKVNKQPDVPSKQTHFIRRPTVLSALLSRKSKPTVNQKVDSVNTQPTFVSELSSELDPNRMFPKCDRTNVGTLIDFSSPPSSPTFTTRSSSDGVSVDSFGSDATTSTNQHNALSGGNASQAESGFEDDFEMFLGSRKPLSKEDTLDDFGGIDPFSPPAISSKPIVPKKPVVSKDLFDNSSSHYAVPPLKGPTIIRAKPARPKPPDNSALLKSTFGNSFPTTAMSVNTMTPIHKISTGFNDHVDSKSLWPERESTPPMPTIPPPPPPVIDDDLPPVWPEDVEALVDGDDGEDCDEPYAVALFDYYTGHQDDLCFSANSRITLIRRVDDEWMYGRLDSGTEGLFPSNYVQVKVPLPNDTADLGVATALYDFEPVQTGDLAFKVGDAINVLAKLNEEWYYGECNGLKGQFPVNYVQMS